MDAIKLLKDQHDEVEALFKQIERLGDRDDGAKERLFIQIADKLAVHASIEEKIFYPAVRASQTDEIVNEAYEEHLGVKRVLSDLLDLEVTDETFDAKLKTLKEQVEHHVEEEESELLPKAKKVLTSDQLLGLAQEMTAMQVELEEKGDPRMAVPAEVESASVH